MRLERAEQLVDAWIQLRDLGWLGELGGQQVDVAATHRCHARVGPSVGMTGQLEQLAHDLGIGLAVEPVPIDGAGGTHFVQQRAMDCPPSGAVGPQERAVNIKEDQTHRSKITYVVRCAWCVACSSTHDGPRTTHDYSRRTPT